MFPVLTLACALLGFVAGLGLPRPIHLLLAQGAGPGPRSPVAGPVAGPVVAATGRYGPLPVAALTGLVCALLAWRLGPGLDLLAFLVLAVAGVTLAIVDVRTLRLPDPVLLVTLATGLTLLGMESLALGDFTAYRRALLGGLTLAGYHLCLAALSRGSLGMGDVKLAGVLGIHLTWLGWGCWSPARSWRSCWPGSPPGCSSRWAGPVGAAGCRSGRGCCSARSAGCCAARSCPGCISPGETTEAGEAAVRHLDAARGARRRHERIRVDIRRANRGRPPRRSPDVIRGKRKKEHSWATYAG